MQASRRIPVLTFSRILKNSSGSQQGSKGSFHQELIRYRSIPGIIYRNMSTGTPTYSAEYLSEKLRKELDAEHIDIEDLSNCGCGMKFDAVIVSPKFEGKPILQRQRLVNQMLMEEMKHIHAFTMRTLTPSQWKEAMSKKQ